MFQSFNNSEILTTGYQRCFSSRKDPDCLLAIEQARSISRAKVFELINQVEALAAADKLGILPINQRFDAADIGVACLARPGTKPTDNDCASCGPACYAESLEDVCDLYCSPFFDILSIATTRGPFSTLHDEILLESETFIRFNINYTQTDPYANSFGGTRFPDDSLLLLFGGFVILFLIFFLAVVALVYFLLWRRLKFKPSPIFQMSDHPNVSNHNQLETVSEPLADENSVNFALIEVGRTRCRPLPARPEFERALDSSLVRDDASHELFTCTSPHSGFSPSPPEPPPPYASDYEYSDAHRADVAPVISIDNDARVTAPFEPAVRPGDWPGIDPLSALHARPASHPAEISMESSRSEGGGERDREGDAGSWNADIAAAAPVFPVRNNEVVLAWLRDTDSARSEQDLEVDPEFVSGSVQSLADQINP